MSSVSVPEGYVILDNPARLDLDVIHGYLTQSYWAKGISRELVARTMINSMCWGIYTPQVQVGFGRIITDRATFAYLCDVFVLPEHRGKGLSKALVATIRAHPDLRGLRRWMLVTADMQKLYAQFGFEPLKAPERHMEIHRHGIYLGEELHPR